MIKDKPSFFSWHFLSKFYISCKLYIPGSDASSLQDIKKKVMYYVTYKLAIKVEHIHNSRAPVVSGKDETLQTPLAVLQGLYSNWNQLSKLQEGILTSLVRVNIHKYPASAHLTTLPREIWMCIPCLFEIGGIGTDSCPVVPVTPSADPLKTFPRDESKTRVRIKVTDNSDTLGYFSLLRLSYQDTVHVIGELKVQDSLVIFRVPKG